VIRFLLDTNVVSELRATRPDQGVVTWVKSLDSEQIFFSVLTIGEIHRGIVSLARRDPQQADSLASWLAGLVTAYGDRILPITAEIAHRWGELNGMRTFPAVDSLIAATAHEHGLTVVTRNVSDFAGLDVAVLNPFA
jgi:predicted nucleic acid-binding protein